MFEKRKKLLYRLAMSIALISDFIPAIIGIVGFAVPNESLCRIAAIGLIAGNIIFTVSLISAISILVLGDAISAQQTPKHKAFTELTFGTLIFSIVGLVFPILAIVNDIHLVFAASCWTIIGSCLLEIISFIMGEGFIAQKEKDPLLTGTKSEEA
jgi:hypothetical protein